MEREKRGEERGKWENGKMGRGETLPASNDVNRMINEFKIKLHPINNGFDFVFRYTARKISATKIDHNEVMRYSMISVEFAIVAFPWSSGWHK